MNVASFYEAMNKTIDEEVEADRQWEMEKIKALGEALHYPTENTEAINPFISLGVVDCNKVYQDGTIYNITLTDNQFAQFLEVIKSSIR